MRLAYLYSRYPVLSQTFCDTEMLELERRGVELVIASMYPPKTPLRHDYLQLDYARPVHYAPREILPWSGLSGTRSARGAGPRTLIAQHERKYGPTTRPRSAPATPCFFVELFEREGIHHFHVHFANRAAHTALFLKAISGIPFSVTAHGQDFMIDLGNDELLREICAAAEFVAAETDYSRDVACGALPANRPRKSSGSTTGSIWASFLAPSSLSEVGRPIRLLSIGRLVEFKGFDVLIDACANLPATALTSPARSSAMARCGTNCRRAWLREILRTRFFFRARNRRITSGSSGTCDIFVLAR